jgi:hypothetical protein
LLLRGQPGGDSRPCIPRRPLRRHRVSDLLVEVKHCVQMVFDRQRVRHLKTVTRPLAFFGVRRSQSVLRLSTEAHRRRTTVAPQLRAHRAVTTPRRSETDRMADLMGPFSLSRWVIPLRSGEYRKGKK